MSKKLTSILIMPLVAAIAHAQNMKDMGDLTAHQNGYSKAHAVSADGRVMVGDAYYDYDSHKYHAFSWTNAGIVDLGDLTSHQQGYSKALAVNAGGTVIVGQASYNDLDASSFLIHAFRWTPAGGMQDLGDLSLHQNMSSYATAVSADGSVVVGEADYNTPTSFNHHAFRWTSEGGMEDLGDLTATQQGYSKAFAVSADGKVVVGEAQYRNRASHAFRWTREGGLESLGDFSSNHQSASYATGVSADGNVIVGGASGGAAQLHAFRWTHAGGMQDLGDFTASQLGQSYANAVNADGSVVVGQAEYDLAAGGFQAHAFRWTSAGTVDLGDFTHNQQGYSYATGVSADGSVVVGTASYDTNQHAFRWTSAGGMEDLGDLTSTQRGYSKATAVSADGSTVVGEAMNDAGLQRAFIYRTSMQDHENLVDSVNKVGADKELAAARQQLGMQRLLEAQCAVGRTGLGCFKVSGSWDTVGADGPIGRRQQTQGLATLGRGLDEQWTLGASLSMTHSRLHHNAVDPKNAYGLSGWLAYSQSGLSELGWQMAASVGYDQQKNTITRGHGLDNVQRVHGSSKLDTVAARIAVGFGVQQPSGWVLTPEVVLTQQHSKFAAYNETQGDFTASYKKASLNTTVLGLGLHAKKMINQQSQLRFSAGVEQDLHVDRMRLSGVSDVPGAETFDMASSLSRKALRPYVTAGYRYQVHAEGVVFVDAGVMRDSFSSKPNVGVMLGYSTRF